MGDKKNPLDIFFRMGDKATRGSPEKKALFDFLLFSILFLAFFGLMINYIIMFFSDSYKISYLMWALVMGVISWFNYWGLKQFRMVYLNMKEFYSNQKIKKEDDEDEKEEESIEEIRKAFN